VPDTSNWVIMAYMNGNNELEPETVAAMREMEETVKQTSKTLLFLQIGRLAEKTVHILRPELTNSPSCNPWNGVRRYAISQSGKVLLGELGESNMADPQCLYDFLSFCMGHEAQHYMLILSGHSCEYIGLLNDYSGKEPCLMGIPELALVLEYIKKSFEKNIDVLVLDTCYSNNIEFLCELGASGSGVKTVLTHRVTAPPKGISYRELFSAIGNSPNESCVETLLKQIIDNTSADLIAYRVDSRINAQIKELFTELAKQYLSCPDEDLLQLLRSEDLRHPGQDYRDNLSNLIGDLIIGRKSAIQEPLQGIGVLDKYIPDQDTAKLYYRLSFARDNYWTRLLCSRLPEKQFHFAVLVRFAPLILSKSKIKAMICSSNSSLSEDEANGILDQLIADRNWNI